MSKINFFKNALRNDFGKIFGINSRNDILQLALKEQSSLDNKNALSKRLVQYRQVREVHIIDYITMPGFSFIKVFELLNQQLSNLKKVKVIVESLDKRQDFSAYMSIIKYAEENGIDLSFVIPVSEKINSKKQFSAILNKDLKTDLHNIFLKRIPVSCLFILNPENCLFADDMLLFCKAVGITQFLFKPSRQPAISKFNNLERFHIAQFFKKLAKFNSPDYAYSKYYNELFLEYSTSTVDRVNKNNNPGEVKTFDQNGNELIGIDYDLNFAPNLKVSDFAQRGIKKVSGIIQKKITQTQKLSFEIGSIQSAKINNPKLWKQVLITGWYGTETAGDKAILGEVLYFIKSCSPNCKITLTTIFDHVSLQTNHELDDLKNVVLVNIKKGHTPELIEKMDAVIMGGGPLMESQSMIDVWRIFKEANKQQKARIIFGCGVGPIHTDQIKEVTIAILKMTTAGFVRDEESYDYASKLFPQHVLKFACDPAVAFVRRWRLANQSKNRAKVKNSLNGATLLRANTNEFSSGSKDWAVNKMNFSAAKQFSCLVEHLCETHEIKVNMLHMNAPWVGGDDRLFNRLVISQTKPSNDIYNERAYLTLEGLLENLNDADFSLAMRYHGHIFSMALGIPFISIDYTGIKGKVFSLMSRIGYIDWSEKWGEVDERRATERIDNLIAERTYWSTHLLEQTEVLVSKLHDVYAEVFDVHINDTVLSPN